jgi:predicted metal-dependent hydrolase
VQAMQVGENTLKVWIPARCTLEEEAHWVSVMTKRFEKRRSTTSVDLARRARELADGNGLPRPASIKWSTTQTSLWGSCTPVDGTIRISDRLAAFPRWVLDYVIVHELAHLVEAGHGPAFQELVSRYGLAERARGFLIAKAMSEPDD